jgi:hypothetical protein
MMYQDPYDTLHLDVSGNKVPYARKRDFKNGDIVRLREPYRGYTHGVIVYHNETLGVLVRLPGTWQNERGVWNYHKYYFEHEIDCVKEN